MIPVTLDQASLRIVSMRRKFVTWMLFYALAVIYVSTAIAPDGFHFVPRAPGDAWRTLLATRYVLNGSDQRADWMANLMMAIPLGLLAMGTLWTPKPGDRRWLMTGVALACCLALVIGVKYAQLFFPPRTVTLNYILAQGLGSVLGIGLFWTLSQKAFASNWTLRIGSERIISTVLWTYAVGLVLYLLFPFDFVLSGSDLMDRMAALPKWLFSGPGQGRSSGVRLILELTQIAETVPIGIIFATRKHRASIPRIAAWALVIMSLVTVASMFVISATPNLISIVFRTIGVVIGAFTTKNFRQVWIAQLRVLLERYGPYVVVLYVLSVLYINGLLSGHWRSIDEARTALDLRGLLPFWHYYIVSKAQAMTSLVVHMVTFAAVGVFVWMRSDRRKGTAGTAALVAFFFSVAIELCRWFKPGLQPDFNNAIIAAISAWLAVKAMPLVWQVAGALPSSTPVSSIAEHAGARKAE